MAHCEVNGINLYYELHGAADAPVVVLINGLLSDTTRWALQVPALAPYFRVLTYDCRGQGQSDKPAGPYPQIQHAHDLHALLTTLDIERAHLVGLSNGGTVAMTFALEYPTMTERLVVTDSFAYADAVMRAKLRSWLVAQEHGGLVARYDVMIPWIWGRKHLAKAEYLLPLGRELVARTDPDGARNLIVGTMDYDIRERLPSITQPMLVIVGREDILTPPWYSSEIARLVATARLVELEDVGHDPPSESPTLFNGLVLAFLRETTG